MSITKRRYSKEEIARRGTDIYEKEVQPHLADGNKGKFLAIDIETGDYEIDKDELEACRNLRARRSDAQIWMIRIGYRSVHRFGGRREAK